MSDTSDRDVWAIYFPGDATLEAYRVEIEDQSTLNWETVQRDQHNVLDLLVDRVPADIGVGVLSGLTMLFTEHAKPDQVGQALLTTIMTDIEPRRVRTLLVTLADASVSAARRPVDERPALVQADMLRNLRRLSVLDLPASELEAISFVRGLLLDVG